MRKISFENFLPELDSISIDHLDLVLTDQNNKILFTNRIGNLYGKTNFNGLKVLINKYHTFFQQNQICKLTIGEMSYSFYGRKFLHNLGNPTIEQLKVLTEKENLNIAQILYLIVNIERVQF